MRRPDCRGSYGQLQRFKEFPCAPSLVIYLTTSTSRQPAMFSGFPQKIPFNLLGDEAKLAFRSQPGGIAKLATTRVSAALARTRLSSVVKDALCSIYPRRIRTGIK